jgi:hypothetical protein
MESVFSVQYSVFSIGWDTGYRIPNTALRDMPILRSGIRGRRSEVRGRMESVFSVQYSVFSIGRDTEYGIPNTAPRDVTTLLVLA